MGYNNCYPWIFKVYDFMVLIFMRFGNM